MNDLAERVFSHLTSLIAVDSQSIEANPEIPSSEGQRELARLLEKFFSKLGLATELDPSANLIVTLPGRGTRAGAPPLALMTHLDTSEGTRAVPKLEVLEAWDGSKVPYPLNADLTVTAANYSDLAYFVGHDIVFGPGRNPVGLDNKIGISLLMGLAEELLSSSPPVSNHEPLLLIFRPDEEIGRMAAVESLAASLERRGVRYGYTIDGLYPFEVNIENFNASEGAIEFRGVPVGSSEHPARSLLTAKITGVITHGSVAKSEGHLNATVIFARAVRRFIGRESGVRPVGFESDSAREADGVVRFLVTASSEEERAKLVREIRSAVETEIAPHQWKGASVAWEERPCTSGDTASNSAASDLLRHLVAYLESDAPEPKLAEDSDGFQGYSNPFAVVPAPNGGLTLFYRIRDFSESALAARENALRMLVRGTPEEPRITIRQQYVNMGPVLKKFPELVSRAVEAAARAGEKSDILPIRGGTGVDPFIERNIPVANLGTGYFAAESEKEITSKQSLARHVKWLLEVVRGS